MAVKWHEEKVQPAGTLSTGGGMKKLVERVKLWQQDAQNWTEPWRSSQDKWHKMRMRIKKKKTFPFKGCSNLRMPTIEIKLRKVKAALSNVIFGIRPIVQAVPSPSGNWETARKIEKFLDHLIMEKIDVKSKSLIAIDQTLEKGFFLLKPYWRVEITNRIEDLSLDDISMQEAQWLFDPAREQVEVEGAIAKKLEVDMNDLVREHNHKEVSRVAEEILSGTEKVKFELQDVIYNCPDVALCEPERVYVPTTTGYDPQSAQYLIHEFYLPLHVLKSNATHKNWDIGSVQDIENRQSTNLSDKAIDITKDMREGIERLQSTNNLVKVWECYCWYDINGDGTEEKCVVTIAPDFDLEMRKITLPFYSGKFPFVKLFYELTSDRWFSHRGIPELIEDIVKEIDIQHMQKIDRQTLTNSPMYIYRAGMVNPKTVQFVFGQGIPAQGMNALGDIMAPLNSHNPNVEFSYEKEQMILETKVEELIGQVDFSLHSMINKREPRTLGEVQLQQQNMQTVFALDADMFRGCYADLWNWLWDLWSQYGDDSYEFMYFGKDTKKEGEKIKLTREETQGKYVITVRGNDQNTNPQNRLQKAQQIMLGTQNEMALNTGVITPIHIANAYKRFYQELDVPNWEELVSTPEEMSKTMQAQQKATQEQKERDESDFIRLTGTDLTDLEKMQLLMKRGIKPDIKGRMLNEQNRRQELDTEQTAKGYELLTKLTDSISKAKTEEKPDAGKK